MWDCNENEGAWKSAVGFVAQFSFENDGLFPCSAVEHSIKGHLGAWTSTESPCLNLKHSGQPWPVAHGGSTSLSQMESQRGSETMLANRTVMLLHTNTWSRRHAWQHVHAHTIWCWATLKLGQAKQSLSSINASTLSELKPGQPARGPALQVGCRQWRLGSMGLPSRRLQRESKDLQNI